MVAKPYSNHEFRNATFVVRGEALETKTIRRYAQNWYDFGTRTVLSQLFPPLLKEFKIATKAQKI